VGTIIVDLPRRRMAMEVHVDRYGMDAMALYSTIIYGKMALGASLAPCW
jgi:hypothetical protein